MHVLHAPTAADEFGGEVAIVGEEALEVLLPAGEFEGEQHEGLREQKCAKADVGALLAEELPEFVAQVMVEHAS